MGKRAVKFLIKLLLSLLALYLLFQRVDFKSVVEVIKGSNFWFLFFAFVFFNLSKVVSSVRLNLFFKALGIKLSEIEALKLYYIGMFYNLFLPGGIGGDGYKIYLLKRANLSGVKELVQATVLDRLSGVTPLFIFAGIFFLFSNFRSIFGWFIYLDILGVVLALPTLWLIYRYLFKRFYKTFLSTTTLGFLTQLLQLILAIFIAKALFIDNFLADVLVIFLVSNIVAVLPVSVGGVGLREWVFLYGFSLLSLPVEKGVAFGVIFFLITAISSFFGLFLKHNLEDKTIKTPS